MEINTLVSVVWGAVPDNALFARYDYGDGSGDGSGDGTNALEYWPATIDVFAAKWPDNSRARLAALRREGATVAFWRSDEHGLPANGGEKTTPAATGVIHVTAGPLKLCGEGTLHATHIPSQWRGERWWIVAMLGETVTDGEKIGALKREILGECL